MYTSLVPSAQKTKYSFAGSIRVGILTPNREDRHMSDSVTFSPSPLNFGPIGPGQKTQGNTQCGTLTAAANVTAAITGDANHVFSVLTVTSYQMETTIVTPDPGEVTGPVKPVKTITAVQKGQTNGVTPLAVASGQYVEVTVQFAPTSSTPNSCTAAVQINGDTWTPTSVSVPLTGSLGEVTADAPTITVVQGKTATGAITVTLAAGPSTTAKLSLQAGTFTPTQIANFPVPAVGYNVSAEGIVTVTAPSSDSISSGHPAKWSLKAEGGSLTPGSYAFPYSGSAFDGAYPFNGTVTVKVELPYFQIRSALGNVVDIANASTKQGAGLDAVTKKTTDNDSQLWTFVPDPVGSGYYYIVSKLDGDVIDIEDASTKSNTLLDAYPRKVAADGFSGSDNQLWYFVADPAAPQTSRIVSKLNGNVVDVQGASTASGALLDSYPVKITGAQNQQWTVDGGNFPSIVPTVPFGPFWGNGNVNYILDGDGNALTGVSVTVDFTSDFSSSANGYGFQLNCYSTVGSSISTVWQQYVVYASPGDNTLYASIDNWSGTFPSFNQVVNIETPLASLPSATIPAHYSITIALTYYQDPQYKYTDQYTAIVTGATYTVKDDKGKVVGTTTIGILGQSLYKSSASATMANLAPISALQLDIVADYNSQTATLTEGAGTITYYASSGFTATQLGPKVPPDSVFNNFAGTGENANIFYGPLPWPWSISMTSTGNQFKQLFQLTPGGLPTIDALRRADLLRRHGLPPRS